MINLEPPKHLDPFQSGMNAFNRGEGWERCPRYDDAYHQQQWQRGWSTACRMFISKRRQPSE